MKIQIGDLVRSYDFESRKDCFIEGRVLAIKFLGGCDRYEIEVLRYVVEGKVYTWNGGNAYPPVNGLPIYGDRTTNGVELIERGSNV